MSLALPRPQYANGALVAHVRHVDRFGNLQLDAGHEDLAGSGLKLGHSASSSSAPRGSHRAQYVRTFADVSATSC